MLATGEKGKKFMKKSRKKKYSNESIGKIKIIRDFLPSPENLVLKEETVKVTLLLSKDSVDFFKKAAEKQHIAYQKMIRSLIDQYTSHYKE